MPGLISIFLNNQGLFCGPACDLSILDIIPCVLDRFSILWLSNGMFYDGGLFAKPCLTLVIPWTLTHHAPLTLGFPRQEYWIGLPFPSPGGPSNSGVEFKSHVLQVDSLLTELPVKP